MGLMQLMPETWVELRDRYGLGLDAYNPHDNILAGTAYLRALYERYGYPGLFAAYNAGPARFDDHLVSGRPLPPETRAYLATLGQPDIAPAWPPAVPVWKQPVLRASYRTRPRQPAMLMTGSSGGLFVSLNDAPEQRP